MVSRRAFIKTSASCLAVASVAGQSSVLWGQNNKLRVRKNLQELAESDIFFKQYGEAVRLMHELPTADPRHFLNQARIHANYCKHGDINFFSWHRPYVAMYEEICGQLLGDSSFTIPYWDWSKREGRIPTPYYLERFLNVIYWKDNGKYNGINWGPVNSLPDRADLTQKGLYALYTKPGANPFTAEFLANTLKTSQFSVLHNIVETQPHNNAHVISGTLPLEKQYGHMGDGLSPLDPIFWNHHCMVDFMWAKWQSNGNITADRNEVFSNMFCDRNGKPITFTNESVRDFYRLGYTYDVLIPKAGLQARLQKAEAQTPEQKILAERLESSKPVSLGATIQRINVTNERVTQVSIAAPDATQHLKESRVYLENLEGIPEFKLEGKRIFAVLKDVAWPKSNSTQFLVNVSLLDTANKEDVPFAVGSFSFFGSAKMAHHGHDVIIDITEGLIQLDKGGRLNKNIVIHLETQSSKLEGTTEADFDLQGIEIITM